MRSLTCVFIKGLLGQTCLMATGRKSRRAIYMTGGYSSVFNIFRSFHVRLFMEVLQFQGLIECIDAIACVA